ncbi:MAG: HAMP domain-containing sensor histidine kinase [Pseudomonadota bacterium]
MQKSPLALEQLNALALHLKSIRESLLQRWRRSSEDDPELTTVSVLSRSQFYDHIPSVLDGFAHRLQARNDADKQEAIAEQHESAVGHGVQRWQQGYRQREVMYEWRHLHLCLVDALEEYSAEHPGLEPQVMQLARRALAELCSEGMCESATQYARLQQADAAGRVHDLERALAQLKQIEQQRAETLREAAHDLRGNLGIVTNATAVLQYESAKNPVRSKVVDILHRGVTSLHSLLDDLMSLARLEAGHEHRVIENFDAAALIAGLCTNLQSFAYERKLFLHTSGPTVLNVEGDQVKVQRIAQNLLLNALKYTERGGVKVMWALVEGGTIPRWQLCIQDTGPGFNDGPVTPMAQALKEATDELHVAASNPDTGSVSEPAPTLKTQSVSRPEYKMPGEGIGLSIVKRLCDLLDANMELETEPGKGSTFRVTFPQRYGPA